MTGQSVLWMVLCACMALSGLSQLVPGCKSLRSLVLWVSAVFATGLLMCFKMPNVCARLRSLTGCGPNTLVIFEALLMVVFAMYLLFAAGLGRFLLAFAVLASRSRGPFACCLTDRINRTENQMKKPRNIALLMGPFCGLLAYFLAIILFPWSSFRWLVIFAISGPIAALVGLVVLLMLYVRSSRRGMVRRQEHSDICRQK